MDPLLEELIEGGARNDEVELILKLRADAVAPPHVRVITRFGDIATCRVRRRRIAPTWEHPTVVSAKAPRLVAAEHGESAGPVTGAADDDASASPFALRERPRASGATGRGVVVGLVDWGLDVAHPNFRRADGSTRLLALWDQGARGGRGAPRPYGYGRVFQRAAIDRALAGTDPYAALAYHPASSDPLGDGAHGTHVCDIAAGNGRAAGGVPGMAPGADLVFVHLAATGTGGTATLGDTCRILEALDFIARVAGTRPWVANLSVGRCGGPHNGLTLVEQGMDQLLLQAPGRAIVQSSGNYFATGGHAASQLRPAERHTLTWHIDRADQTPNELEVWYPGLDVMSVELLAPDGTAVAHVPLGSRADILVRGKRCGRAYHRRHDPSNGDHHVDILLGPDAPAGAWRLVLIGEDIVDGRFDAWVERDSACARCQSRFDPRDVVPQRTTGTICNGLRTIAVGAYDSRQPHHPVARFSSAGPTRDGRQKPDLCAPGVQILAARSAGFGVEAMAGLLTTKSGTSMAAPHVAGTIACMFEAAGRPLWIHETRRLLLGTARGANAPPDQAARLGSGHLDAERAVAAARASALDRALVTGTARTTTRLPMTAAAAPQAVAPRPQLEDRVMSYNAWSAAGTEPTTGNVTLDETWSEEIDDTLPEEVAAESEDDLAGDALDAVGIAESVLHAESHSDTPPTSLLAALLGDDPDGSADVEALRDTSGGIAILFDSFARGRQSTARGPASRFDLVALPGERPRLTLARGDVVLRRTPGESPLAHLALLATGDLAREHELARRGWVAERGGLLPGWYALVIEGGSFPHCAHRPFARRVLDARGEVPRGQLLLRTRTRTLRLPGSLHARRVRRRDEGLAEASTTMTVRTRNRILPNDVVSDCAVELVGTSARVTTNAAGVARLDLAGVADGEYTLRATPASHSVDPVGPALATATPRPSRIWRPLTATVTVRGERITASPSTDVRPAGTALLLRLQPVWTAAANSSARASSDPAAVTHVVVHHTAGPRAGPALNWFLNPAGPSAHYLIDTDGEIVKLVHESRASWHAGTSHWGGRDSVNGFSIGIEVVHEQGEYAVAQYDALIALLGRLRLAFPFILPTHVVGHSDIATGRSPRRLGRKAGDPGLDFDWVRLERAGFGFVVPSGPVLGAAAYGGFFDLVPNGRLAAGDRDAGRRYGGAPRPSITTDVIRELQGDLRGLGYLCPDTGRYDEPTTEAVKAFQARCFSGSRPRVPAMGRLDRDSAAVLKALQPATLATSGRAGAASGSAVTGVGATSDAAGDEWGEMTLAEGQDTWPIPDDDETTEDDDTFEAEDDSWAYAPSSLRETAGWRGDDDLDAALLDAAEPTTTVAAPAPRATGAAAVVLHRRTVRLPLTDKRVRMSKAIDPRRGEVAVVATDVQSGARVDAEALLEAERRARAMRYGTLHPVLFREVQRHRPGDEIPIAIWVRVVEPDADKALHLRLPVERPLLASREETQGEDEDESTRPGGGRGPERPAVNAEEPPAPLVAYRRIVSDARARVKRTIEERVHKRVESELETVPLLMMTATPEQIRTIAQVEGVDTVYLHETEGVDDLVTSMADSRADTVVSTMGWTGRGVRVAVWERGPDDLSQLDVAAHFDSTRSAQSSHARLTSGIIKNTQSSGPKGFAPDCELHSANSYDLKALEWAVTRQRCTVISQSFHRDAEETDGTLSLDDRVKDYLAMHWPYPTIVQAAGNSSAPGTEFVNHKGYNSLAVASHDDGASHVASTSVFRNPTSPHADRELPELAANGTNVSAVGQTSSGTSFAAPAVAGTVALLQHASAALRHWPEGCRAILLAAAGRNLEGSTWWNDVWNDVDAKDGSGVLDAAESVRIARSRRARNDAAATRGWDVGTLGPADVTGSRASFVYRVEVPARGPRHVKVALAWNSRTTATTAADGSITNATSELRLDLDLLIYDGTRLVARSASWDNSYEVAEFRGERGKRYDIVIRRLASAPAESTWYGIGWTVR